MKYPINDKISNITNLATSATLNAKMNGVKKEIPSITNLTPNASINAKINEVKGKYLPLLQLLRIKYLTLLS